MTEYQRGALNTFRTQPHCQRAVVFLHGFSGDRDDTWDRLPGLLGTSVSDWDIYTLGYATTFLPDLVGVWSADPDIPILATMLTTQASIDPLSRYKSLAVVAHSMGGLVVQRALVDDPKFADRTDKVILFGTPSTGLRKASWVAPWKRQLRNMAAGSEFIKKLRQDWDSRFERGLGFQLMVVAGEQDQFVPPESNLAPFPRQCWRVVPGNHLSMVRAADSDSPSVRLLVSALSDAPAADDATSQLALAAEIPDATASALIEAGGDRMSQLEVVRAALAFEQNGKRDEAMALLHRYQTLGTDVQGTLAGRIKRMWIENEDFGFAQHALSLYQAALDQAREMGDASQVYYHAINVAFLEFVAFDRLDRAREMAELALIKASVAEENAWSVATQAEANLYLGRRDVALYFYRRMLAFKAEHWEYSSTALQAGQIASKLKDDELADSLEDIFTPTVRQANTIFVSYSHQDEEWKNRLFQMLEPFLRDGDLELKQWVDEGNIKPGDRWHEEIQNALKLAGVAVVLVSAPFLSSEYVMRYELPAIISAAADGKLRLLWVYVSHAGYEATELEPFQAAHDVSKPLYALERPEQDAILLNIARDIKAAALGATERFRDQDQRWAFMPPRADRF